MTPKQERFVEEYLIDLNATQAAIRAGYSDRGADVQGCRLLGNARVALSIAERRKKLSDVIEVSQERLTQRLAQVAFTDLSDVVRWGSREVQIGFDADGKRLPADQISEAVLVRTELAPYVDAIESDQLSPRARAAVSEVALTKDGLKIKMHDKVNALVQLGRTLGMFTDNVKVSVSLETLIREYLPVRGPEVIEGEVVSKGEPEE